MSSNSNNNNANNNNTNNNKPRDGPATSFHADPLLKCIQAKDANFFCLVLVAGWPNEMGIGLNVQYQNLLAKVRECFDSAVTKASSSSSTILTTTTTTTSNLENATTTATVVSPVVENPNSNIDINKMIYLYPIQYLHVTVATLVKLERKCHNEEYYNSLIEKYTNLIQQASQNPNWPKTTTQETSTTTSATSTAASCIKLELDNIQFGSNAGILLWKEQQQQQQGGLGEKEEGTISKIRRLLQNQADQMGLPIHSIPGIIHTTFVRYLMDIPEEKEDPADTTFSINGIQLQQEFQNRIVSKKDEIFSMLSTSSSLSAETQQHQQQPLILHNVSMVCERTPYMHIPNDDQHVFVRLQV